MIKVSLQRSLFERTRLDLVGFERLVVEQEPIVFLDILLISAADYTLAFPTVKAVVVSCLEFVVRFYWVI